MNKFLKTFGACAILLASSTLTNCGVESLTEEQAMNILETAVEATADLTKFEVFHEAKYQYISTESMNFTSETTVLQKADIAEQKYICYSTQKIVDIFDSRYYRVTYYQNFYYFEETGDSESFYKIEESFGEFSSSRSLAPIITDVETLRRIGEGVFVSAKQSGKKTIITVGLLSYLGDKILGNWKIIINDGLLEEISISTKEKYSDTTVVYVSAKWKLVNQNPIFDFSYLSDIEFE